MRMVKAGSANGCVLVPAGWLDGGVSWDETGYLTAVTGSSCPPPSPDAARIIPGFIDPHVHGGNGADAMRGEQDVRRMVRFHATCGTVALAPTTMTGKCEDIAFALDGIEKVRDDQEVAGAEVLGTHLEGPFLNPKRLGAQPPLTILHDKDLVADWLSRAKLVVATIAPEMEKGMDLLAQLVQAGVKTQIGHTDATATQTYAALQAGASGFTHLYNAMPSYSHRNAGAVDAALAWGEYAEIICDLEHVHEPAVRVATRAIAQAYAITDATAAAGLPDGEYELGEQTVHKQGGTCRTQQGVLAGSALTMWDIRQRLLGIGFSEHLVQEMLSARVARYLGRDDLGEIEVGRAASVVRLEGEVIDAVWVRGRRLLSLQQEPS